MIRPQNCAAIMVAAGLSSRFGAGDKLMADICGAPLFSWSLKPLLSSGLGQIIVVTGANDREIRTICGHQPILFMNNFEPAAGLGVSIAAGAGAVRKEMKGVFICLGDMPLTPADIFHDLIAALDADETIDGAAPVHNGRRGHPVLFHGRHLAALTALSGDEGAKSIIGAPGFRLRLVNVDDEGILQDVDNKSDIAQMERAIKVRNQSNS